MRSLPAEDIIRDEGTACIIHTQSTAPNRFFSSLEFQFYLDLRLGIQIARQDINCTLCANDAGLSNRQLVNGCKKKNYANKTQNVILEGITSLCKVGNVPKEFASSFCFNQRTNKRL